MKNHYTDEKNIQILISLLKKHNIKHIIASPGSTNISFVASVQSDDFFKIISCVDERSAAYIACGLAAELNEPVVITCTGATASRNYIPGLTEAYYRKLPIIAITATQHLGRIGHNVAQVLDRTNQLNDMVKKSIQLEEVHSEEDKWSINTKINDALLECRRNGGGPVHINMVTTYNNNFNCEKLPDERKINRITPQDVFPKISYDNVAIFIGNHQPFNRELEEKIEKFCELYNGVVLCDHTSNYNGKYKIMASLICNQPLLDNMKNIDLLIDIGNISGAYFGLHPKNVWRINEDGVIRDTYKKLSNIFEMSEYNFFNKYISENDESKKQTKYYESWAKCYKNLNEKLDKLNLPFSNIWVAKQTINKIEKDNVVHLAILNTLRSWNFFEAKNKLKFFSNTGGFGIDGIMSSAIGSSLATDKNVYCFIGDLAFFYDMNSIGNCEIKSNLRILVVNNGCGTEFHNYNHRAAIISDENKLDPRFFAADGHFGNKSEELVKNYTKALGFKYLSAKNKDEFLLQIDSFINDKSNAPIIFEIFTNSVDESDALKMVRNLETDMKTKVKDIIGTKKIRKIKKIIGK